MKQILDPSRCDQLQEGDILIEVNGQRLIHYNHLDVISLLKKCPKGQETFFTVARQRVIILYSYYGLLL